MKTKIYHSPRITLTKVKTECSIANTSIQIGTDGKFVPEIEDFINDQTEISGFNDI